MLIDEKNIQIKRNKDKHLRKIKEYSIYLLYNTTHSNGK